MAKVGDAAFVDATGFAAAGDCFAAGLGGVFGDDRVVDRG